MKNFWNEEIMNIPVCKDLCNNWETIRDEALLYLDKPHPYSKNKSSTIPYPTYSIPSLDDPSVDEKLYEGKWEIAPVGLKKPKNYKDDKNYDHNPLFGLSEKFLEKYTKWKTGKTIDENLEYAATQFVFLHNLLQRNEPDSIMSASLSTLTPGSIINPHVGGEHFIRCHLCLINDEGCSITVNGETQKWKNGKITAFKDSERHSVVHNGTKTRLVFLFDISIEYAKKYISDLDFQSLPN
jgi:aspartyl/asparaginyl beta-hydroxylase (cupin superfamily)